MLGRKKQQDRKSPTQLLPNMDKPFIGIRGVRTVEEVETIKEILNQTGFTTLPYTATIGIHVRREMPYTSRLAPHWDPSLKGLDTILRSVGPTATPIIKYKTDHAADMPKVHEQVRQLFNGYKIDGHTIQDSCSTVQINAAREELTPPRNVVWLKAFQLKAIKNAGIDIILQLNHAAINGRDPDDLARKLKEFEGLVSYAIIDPSGDSGNANDVLPIIRAINQNTSRIRAGYSIGHGPGSIESSFELLRATSDALPERRISLEVHSEIRTHNGKAIDPIKTKKYLECAAGTIRELYPVN
jgi:hypothetical protein